MLSDYLFFKWHEDELYLFCEFQRTSEDDYFLERLIPHYLPSLENPQYVTLSGVKIYHVQTNLMIWGEKLVIIFVLHFNIQTRV